MADQGEDAGPNSDYSRQLGVVEALTLASRQCPNGSVRNVATQALESLKSSQSSGLREQVYFVLSAIQGWRGERARQIHDSLAAYLESASKKHPQKEEDPAT